MDNLINAIAGNMPLNIFWAVVLLIISVLLYGVDVKMKRMNQESIHIQEQIVAARAARDEKVQVIKRWDGNHAMLTEIYDQTCQEYTEQQESFTATQQKLDREKAVCEEDNVIDNRTWAEDNVRYRAAIKEAQTSIDGYNKLLQQLGAE